MNFQEKAKQLINKFGKDLADKFCNQIMDEIQTFDISQHQKDELIDNYLDVKNAIKKH